MVVAVAAVGMVVAAAAVGMVVAGRFAHRLVVVDSREEFERVARFAFPFSNSEKNIKRAPRLRCRIPCQ